MMYGAQCEYKKLKKVLMHRPSRETDLITLENKDEYLFRDIVSWRKFQKEHDRFTNALREEGVEVILVEELLGEEKKKLIEKSPNLVYMRDTFSVTNSGAVKMRMANLARKHEPEIVEEALKKLKIPIVKEIQGFGILEGGDIVYPEDRVLMVGYGPRSNEEGVLQLKDFVLGNTVEEVVAVPLPSFRVHLDGALMFLSKDVCVLHEKSLSFYPTKIYRECEDLVFVMDYIKEKGYDIVKVTDKEVRVFGPNLVSLGGEKVVSYDWNERIISELHERGFDVIPIEGGELSRGGGGPHCMTCPIRRE